MDPGQPGRSKQSHGEQEIFLSIYWHIENVPPIVLSPVSRVVSADSRVTCPPRRDYACATRSGTTLLDLPLLDQHADLFSCPHRPLVRSASRSCSIARARWWAHHCSSLVVRCRVSCRTRRSWELGALRDDKGDGKQLGITRGLRKERKERKPSFSEPVAPGMKAR